MCSTTKAMACATNVENLMKPIVNITDAATPITRPSTLESSASMHAQVQASTEALADTATTALECAAKSPFSCATPTSGLPRVSTASLAAMRANVPGTEILSVPLGGLESCASIPNFTTGEFVDEAGKRRSSSADLSVEQVGEFSYDNVFEARKITRTCAEHRRRSSRRCATAEATMSGFHAKQTRAGPPTLATVARAEARKTRRSSFAHSDVSVEPKPWTSGTKSSPVNSFRVIRTLVGAPTLATVKRADAPRRRTTTFAEAGTHSASAYRVMDRTKAPTNIAENVNDRLVRTGRRPATVTEKELMDSFRACPTPSSTESKQCVQRAGFVEMAFDVFSGEDEGLNKTNFSEFCFRQSAGAGKSPIGPDAAKQIFQKVVPEGQSLMNLQHFRQALSAIGQLRSGSSLIEEYA